MGVYVILSLIVRCLNTIIVIIVSEQYEEEKLYFIVSIFKNIKYCCISMGYNKQFVALTYCKYQLQ